MDLLPHLRAKDSFSNVYNVVLNSAGNTMTLSNTDSPTSITINSLNVQAGELDCELRRGTHGKRLYHGGRLGSAM